MKNRLLNDHEDGNCLEMLQRDLAEIDRHRRQLAWSLVIICGTLFAFCGTAFIGFILLIACVVAVLFEAAMVD